MAVWEPEAVQAEALQVVEARLLEGVEVVAQLALELERLSGPMLPPNLPT